MARSAGLLTEARDLRRNLKGEVSFWVRHREMLDDLATEATLVGPNMAALAKHRWCMVLELPSKLEKWNFASNLLIKTFWVIFVVVACLLARRQAPRVVRGLLRRWAARSRRYLPRDMLSMARPAERAIQALVDLAVGTGLLGLLARDLPELVLVCLVYLQVALYRSLTGLAALAVASRRERRPALLTLVPDAREMVLKSVRVLVLWLIARQFSRFVAIRILDAQTLDEALRVGFNVLLAALVVWLLHLWEPELAPRSCAVTRSIGPWPS